MSNPAAENSEPRTKAFSTPREVQDLIGRLDDDDGLKREATRNQLAEIGGSDVIRALINELNDPRVIVRWEATKTLVAIADPIIAPALVPLLRDEDNDVRWVAAEGLAALGEPGLLATLSSAIRNARDPDFCFAVRHAFKTFKNHGTHSQYLAPVIEACDGHEPGVSLPVAAYEALQQIKIGNRS